VSVDRELFFRLMASFASSVTVVTSRGPDGVPRGFTASAFCSVSLDPRLCLVCVDLRSESLPGIQEGGSFAVNILADGQEELSRRFASKAPDKFDGLAFRDGDATGSPILNGALAWIECRIHQVHEGGDHVIVVGEIQDGDALEASPLLYFRGQYRRLSD
jgi:flavin reductase (DIM6/NTAB) family NADH-FMN oxidoreductase RutF